MRRSLHRLGRTSVRVFLKAQSSVTSVTVLIAFVVALAAALIMTRPGAGTAGQTIITDPVGAHLSVAQPVSSASVATPRPFPTTTTTTTLPTTTVLPTTTIVTVHQAAGLATTTTIANHQKTSVSTMPSPTPSSASAMTLPPGATLPSDATCASQVIKTKEYRSGNTTANKTKPTSKPSFDKFTWGSDPAATSYLNRIDGNFAGTTDEIIQWASCKWGFDPNITRAQVMVESSWRQTAQGAATTDQTQCVGGMTAPCPLAFGLLQIRADKHPGTYPYSASSTAFNVDYALAMRRACYDGHLWVGTTAKGDLWGCVGVHRSGQLNDPVAKGYDAQIQQYMITKPWLSL